MKRTEIEPVTRTYCDECGKDVTGTTHYGRGDRDYCSDHKPWLFRDVVRAHALSEIRRQPFMVANGFELTGAPQAERPSGTE